MLPTPTVPGTDITNQSACGHTSGCPTQFTIPSVVERVLEGRSPNLIQLCPPLTSGFNLGSPYFFAKCLQSKDSVSGSAALQGAVVRQKGSHDL